VYSCCINACVRVCVCDWVCFCVWVHVCVRARVHASPGLSDLGPSIIWGFTRISFHQFSLKVGLKHPNYLDAVGISSPELDPQPWRFTNNSLIFTSHDNRLGCTMYPPQTPHFIRTVYLSLTKDRSSLGRAQAPHWLASCWSHP